MLYKPIQGKLRAKVVHDEATKKIMLNDGWGLTPADFGVETAPAAGRLTKVLASVAPPQTDESVAASIPDISVPEKVEVKKGGRKPWSEEQKQAARERMLALRAKTKAVA